MSLILRLWILVTLSSLAISIKVDDNFETVHNSNAAVLNRLGLTPIEIPPSHYKKRLSGLEPQALSPSPSPPSSSSSSLHYSSPQSRIHQPYSRRHGHHDSHVYVVKLPASPPYYTVTKPVKPINKEDKKKQVNRTGISFDNGIYDSTTIHKTPPVGFNSNGKPDKIYHWNLPLMRKINDKKRQDAIFKMDLLKKNFIGNNFNQIGKNYDDKKWINYLIMAAKLNGKNSITSKDKKSNKQTRNNDKLLNYYKKNIEKESAQLEDFIKIFNNDNSTRKMYRFAEDSPSKNDLSDDKKNYNYFDKGLKELDNFKQRKIKAPMTFYAPITTEATELSMSNNIKKNFPGNGKPKAFYVMEKSRRKPIYYHSLLP